jgi:hypothetical protein
MLCSYARLTAFGIAAFEAFRESLLHYMYAGGSGLLLGPNGAVAKLCQAVVKKGSSAAAASE